MNIESVLKAKELLDAQKKAKEANWVALQIECELQFEECRAVLNELKPQLKMKDLKIGGNGFSYRPHETLSQTTSYAVTIHNGEVAYCRKQSDACYLSKEKFFNEITETLAFYL
jgi:predicted RNase H-like nuclease (RuvC/YqgF family)